MNVLNNQGAMVADGKSNVRPMTKDANTPAEISALFDSIAYPKSASVLRMFNHIIGDSSFKEALNLYLVRNQYRGTVSQDLMDAFTTTLLKRNSNFDFEHAFRTWELQAGVPVINVHFNASIESFQVTQERFFENKNMNEHDHSSWYIPLNFATESFPNFDDTRFTHFFVDDEPMWNIFVPQHTAGQWYVFNKQQIGYYRVNYDAENWHALSEALSSEKLVDIHIMNRVQLIDDVFALTNAGYLSDYETAFNILKYLANEDDYFPWFVAFRNLYPLIEAFEFKNPIMNVRIFV
jgi:aminopeptidase N